MKKFCIECCGAKCIIDADRDLRSFFKENSFRLTFPNLKIIVSDFENVKYMLKYRNCLEQDKKINCTDDFIEIYYPGKNLTDSNIAYVSRYLIEKQFAENSMATCHSACVEKDGKAILLLGGSGSGKTSVALNLCLYHNFSLISNDQTLIGLENGILYAYGGTKFLNLRYSSISENVPSLIGLFNCDNIESWSDKIIVQASDLGINEQYNPVEITEIYILHVDNRENNFYEKKGDNWAHNFNLYQNLTENIRNSNSAIVDIKGHPIGYVPSYDSENNFLKRVEMIELIDNNPNYKYLSGSLNEILEYILNKRKLINGEKRELKILIKDR